MANRNVPIISDYDMQLFIRIAKHGFVDMKYVYTFTYKSNKPTTIDDRIRQLTMHGYLASYTTFAPAEYTASGKKGFKVITLGIEGVKLMRFYEYSVIDNLAALKCSSPYRMYHQVQLSMVCDTLQEKYKDSTLYEVYKIFNERECINDVVTMQPDALILFKPKDKSKDYCVAVFVEIERSYASQMRIDKKLQSYALAIRKEVYNQKFKEKIIMSRVLFVSQTKSQFNMVMEKAKASEYVNNIDVLCVSYQSLIEDPLGSNYKGLDDKEYKLLSKLEK